MALKITITDAGRAELINAQHTGTTPVTLSTIAFSAVGFNPTAAMAALPDEIKRVDSIAGEAVADDTITITAKDEAQDAYTMYGFGVYTEAGTLFAVYGQDTPIIEKAAASTMLLTIDIVLADIDADTLHFGDATFSNPPASLTTPGVTKLSNATDSTAQTHAATPRAVKSANDNANTRLAKNQNLADLPNPNQARSNLGLGASATLGTTASRTSSSAQVLLQAKGMNDHRQSADHDARYYTKGEANNRFAQGDDFDSNGNYGGLRARATTKSDVGLGNLPNSRTSSRNSDNWDKLLTARGMYYHKRSGDHDGRYVQLTDQNVSIEYEGSGLKVRTLNNNGSFIFQARSSGQAPRFTVAHGAPELNGGPDGWKIDGKDVLTEAGGKITGSLKMANNPTISNKIPGIVLEDLTGNTQTIRNQSHKLEVDPGDGNYKRIYHEGYKPNKSDVGLGNLPNSRTSLRDSDNWNQLLTARGMYNHKRSGDHDSRYKRKGQHLTWGATQITGYLNGYDAKVDWQAPYGCVVTGVISVHSNYSEDRRFRYRYRKVTI